MSDRRCGHTITSQEFFRYNFALETWSIQHVASKRECIEGEQHFPFLYKVEVILLICICVGIIFYIGRLNSGVLQKGGYAECSSNYETKDGQEAHLMTISDNLSHDVAHNLSWNPFCLQCIHQ